MEFTVSKSELVRELSLSQGVVEKKTTIPILSNVLLEADGDRLVHDSHGSGAGDPLQLSGEGDEAGRRNDSGARSCSTMFVCCPIPTFK